jgi:type IV pilus assembly protein PilC
MEYKYTARTKEGDTKTGTLTANSEAAASNLLKQKGLRPIVVKPVGGKGINMNIKLPGGKKVKAKHLVIFTRQLSTMINAGVPILRALTTMRDQTGSPALKEALDQVIADVQGGAALSDSLGKHPKIFSEVYVNMVRAGESGGILDQILGRLANQVEKDAKIKGKLKGALIYPAVVTLVAICAVTGVIPKLAGILTENNVELPIYTKAVIGLSNLLLHGWPIILAVLALSLFAFRRYIKTPSGKYNFHKVLLKIPVFGTIIMKVNIARFARTFSSLAAAGVTVIESLNVTSGSLGNEVIKKGIQDSIVQIRNGRNISDSLGESGVMPQIIIQMAAVGEETGQLDTVLEKVAEFYEEEVDTVIDGLASIIEPILIVSLGGVVGIIVLSVLGPIFSLQGSI